MKFEGFSPETFDFLWGIRMNNNREWFLENKPRYVEKLYEPMKALGKELFEPFLNKPGNLVKVSRIYRDARMHHPDPYKESLWICIRQDVQWWAENPCLYFEIRPEGVSYGFFFWQPGTARMESFRRDITERTEDFLQLIRETEQTTGVPVTAQLYKRPKPTDKKELEPFFAWRGAIECTVNEEPGENLFTPELAQRVRTFFEQLTPLYEYFNSI